MAKLIFVTGPTASGKTQYINRDRGHMSSVIEEAQDSGLTIADIHDLLRLGHDVYVSWIVPEGTSIEWINVGKQQ